MTDATQRAEIERLRAENARLTTAYNLVESGTEYYDTLLCQNAAMLDVLDHALERANRECAAHGQLDIKGAYEFRKMCHERNVADQALQQYVKSFERYRATTDARIAELNRRPRWKQYLAGIVHGIAERFRATS